MSTYHSKSPNSGSDLNWDAFVASLHRVWEYAPDYSPTGPIQLSGHFVLIVDHDRDHNRQLSDHLMRVGSTAITVGTIESAQQILDKHPIDMIVIGVTLPDETTLEFCRAVYDFPGTANVPIIMLTDDDRPEMIWRARRAGVKFYLRKPYDPYVLLTLMSAALEPAA